MKIHPNFFASDNKLTLISNGHPLHEISIKTLVGYLEANGIPCRSIYLNSSKKLTESQTTSVLDICKNSNLVGFSLMSKDVKTILPISDSIRKSGTNVIWGGIHATAMPNASLEHSDFVCIGEGELTLLTLYKFLSENNINYSSIPNLAFKRDGEQILPEKFHSESSLDKLPYPDYEFSEAYMLCSDGELKRIPGSIEEREKFFGMSTFLFYSQRGCPFSCSYCSNSLYHNIAKKTNVRWYRTVSPNRFKEEIRHHLKYVFVKNEIWINDDDFISRPIEELEEIGKFFFSELKLKFNINATPSAVNYDKVEVLAKYGLRQIAMGVQTGSGKILKDVYKRHVMPEMVLKAADIISKFYHYGVVADYGFILENPYEQPEDYRETIRLFIALPKTYTVSLYSLAFFPSTVLTERALSDNVISAEDISLDKDYRESIKPSFFHFLFEANYYFQLPKEINDILLSDTILISDSAKYLRLLLSNYFLSNALKEIVYLYSANSDEKNQLYHSSHFDVSGTYEFIYIVKEILQNWSMPSRVLNTSVQEEDMVLEYQLHTDKSTPIIVSIGFKEGRIIRLENNVVLSNPPANALNGNYKNNSEWLKTLNQHAPIKMINSQMMHNALPISASGWTFGIVTNGQRDTWVDELIESIQAQNVEDYEILVCGTYSNQNNYDINHIEFNGDENRGWITKKKNLIIQNSAKDNICILHDRMRLDAAWYEGMKQFGNDFEFQYCSTYSIDNTTEHNSALGAYVEGGYMRICNMPHGTYKTGLWIDGGQMIGKSKHLKENLLDEDMLIGEGEDVEWCRRVVSKGYQIKHNPFSKLLNMGSKKIKDDYNSSMVIVSHPSAHRDLFKYMLISTSEKWGLGIRSSEEVLSADKNIASISGNQLDEIISYNLLAYNEPFYALWRGLIFENNLDYKNAAIQFKIAWDKGIRDARISKYIDKVNIIISKQHLELKNNLKSFNNNILGNMNTMELSDKSIFLKEISNLYNNFKKGISQPQLDAIVHPVWQKTLSTLGELITNGIPDNFLQHQICKDMFVRTGWEKQQDIELNFIKSCDHKILNLVTSLKESPIGGIKHDCKEMDISVNTLGMLWYYANISNKLISTPKTVVEFGGGFGSLARIFKLFNSPELTYVIIDLPEMLMLQYYYLAMNLGLKSVNLIRDESSKIVPGCINLVSVFQSEGINIKADLFISTFALSETSSFTQKLICEEKKFFNADYVYITGQEVQERQELSWNTPHTIVNSVNSLFKSVEKNPFHIGSNYELLGGKIINAQTHRETITLIFSKDRALQLNATIESLLFSCTDIYNTRIVVLFKATSAKHRGQYEILSDQYPNISFIEELDFRAQVKELISHYIFVLFLVDDNIFVKNFELLTACELLKQANNVLGVSLRLGINTDYNYMADKPQPLPEFGEVTEELLIFEWTKSQLDFNYPLEVSSSIYRSYDVSALIEKSTFNNPNSLEDALHNSRKQFTVSKPLLLCYKQSVTFCNPVNIVQTYSTVNRNSRQIEYSAENLSFMFDNKRFIDIRKYNGFVPNAAHVQVDLFFKNPVTSTNPLVSVIIPCYNQAHFLTEAVESIINQTYTNWEIVIVNDGSPDNIEEIANLLIEKYSSKNIRLFSKNNGGLSEARNYGIQQAIGEWILPLDCDDYFHTEFLSNAIELIHSNPNLNLIFSNMQEFGLNEGEWLPEEYSVPTLLRFNTFPYASIYKKALWTNSNGYYQGIPWCGEDWNFWIEISKFNIQPGRIVNKMFYYRTAPDSMYQRMLPHFEEVKAFIQTLHPDLYGPQKTLEACSILSTMHKDTYSKLTDIITKHPDLAMPYLWKGLYHLAGNQDIAMQCFAKAVSIAEETQDDLPGIILYDILKMKKQNDRVTPAPKTSNVSYWKQLQDNNYFENHQWYGKLNDGLKIVGNDYEFISKYVNLNKEMNVVVVGCGYGREAALIAPHVKMVYGVDVSETILNKASHFLSENNIHNFTPVLAEEWENKIPENIDFVYCIVVFQHLTKDLTRAYINGLGNKLNDNGKMLCQFAENPGCTSDAELKAYEPNVGWSNKEIEELILDSGLKLFEMFNDPVVETWHWSYFGKPQYILKLEV